MADLEGCEREGGEGREAGGSFDKGLFALNRGGGGGDGQAKVRLRTIL